MQSSSSSATNGKIETVDLQQDTLELDVHPAATLKHIDPTDPALLVPQKGPSLVNDVESLKSTTTLEPNTVDEAIIPLENHISISGDERPSTMETPNRVLSRKHFVVALSEIRPSSSEEGSLPELRKVSSFLQMTLIGCGQSNLVKGELNAAAKRASGKDSALAILL